MSEYFGFELLFTSVKGQLKEDHDLLVVAFHWLLIREHFLCIGIGVEVIIPSESIFHSPGLHPYSIPLLNVSPITERVIGYGNSVRAASQWLE